MSRLCKYKLVKVYTDGTKLFVADKNLMRCIGLFFLKDEAGALSLGDYIFVTARDEFCGVTCINRRIAHEYAHTLQFRKYSSLGYFLLYFFFLFVNYIRYKNLEFAYHKVPFEVEARKFSTEVGLQALTYNGTLDNEKEWR